MGKFKEAVTESVSRDFYQPSFVGMLEILRSFASSSERSEELSTSFNRDCLEIEDSVSEDQLHLFGA